MKKTLLLLAALSFIAFNRSLNAQTICNSTGDLIIFSNYDGGTLTINVDQNIPNLKIGICSYEGVVINLSGAFINNVVAVRYAGYNGNNLHCTQPNTTIINGAPSGAVTSTVFAPAATLSNSNGYGSIICASNCNNGVYQGGCNTVDQVEAYFLNYFSGSTLFAHKVQYGCWTGTQSVSVGGNCCPPVPVIPGGVTSSQTICAGQVPAAFSNTQSATSTSGIISYSWQASTSSSSGFANISGANSSTYAPGALSTTMYFRRAASTSANNVAYSNVIAVTVNPAPVLVISGGNGVCPAGSATLTATGAANYTWLPGPIIANQITVNSSSLGTYTLNASSAFGCTATAVKNMSLHALPTISITGVASVCPGSSVTLFAAGANSYVWSPGNVNGGNYTVSQVIATTYAVTGTDLNGCVNSANHLLGVFNTPTVAISPANGIACKNQSLVLTSSGANTYTWFPGNVTASQILLSNPTTSITYTVTGKGPNNCTSTTIFPLTVQNLPAISISVATQPVCSGKPASLIASGAVSYTWNPSSVQGTSISIIPASSGNYTVIGDDGTCKNTATVSLLVLPSPSVTITSARLRICAGEVTRLNAAGATSYSWMTTGNITTATINVSPAATNDFTVVGTATNNCQSQAKVTVTVSECTGMAEGDISETGLNIFPNPAHDKLTITAKTKVSFFIIGLNGQVVKSVSLDEGNNFSLEVSGLAPGTYLLKGDNGTVLKQKIVITD